MVKEPTRHRLFDSRFLRNNRRMGCRLPLAVYRADGDAIFLAEPLW